MDALVGQAVATKIVPILHVWMTVLLGLITFGIAGLAATAFLADRRVSMMAAPLAGIALWPLATLALYVGCPPELALNFDSAARFSLAALGILSFLLVPLNRSSFDAAWRSLAIVAIASVIIAPIVMMATLDRGEPALLYLDGADHIGYAMMADWYRSHPPQTVVEGVVGPAVNDPTQPYVSGIQLNFETDVRGGAFAYLALVSMLSGLSQSAVFSYDTAFAIVLIAACLGCAAVFSRSWVFLLCLAAALLTGLWYDYGHMGFFGKILSYPLALFTFGVFLSFYRSKAGPGDALALAMLAAGAGLMHNAVVYGLLFTCLAAPFLLTETLLQRQPPKVADCALAAFPPLVAMVASGTLTRPLNALVYGDYKVGWEKVAVLLSELNSLFPDVSLVPRLVLAVLLLLCMLAWAMLTLLAVANRSASALALLCGPAALVLVLYVLNQPKPALQLAGFPYPAMLCAAFLLAQDNKPSGRGKAGLRQIVAAAVLLALVSMHVPRAIGSVLRYTRDADRRQMFAASDFDRLQDAIGDQEVYIDIQGGNARTIGPILAEFSRRNVKSVWSPHGWYIIGSFRGAPLPPMSRMPDLRLIDATQHESPDERIVVETRRYKLLRRAETSTDQHRN
jgi:hypothetical protein